MSAYELVQGCGYATGESDGNAYAVIGGVWAMIPLAPARNSYFRNPRDVDVCFMSSGREVAPFQTVRAETDSASQLAELAGEIAADSGAAAGIFASNCADALRVVDGKLPTEWKAMPCDHRGATFGGCDVFNGDDIVSLTVDDETGQWCVYDYRRERNIYTAVADHGGDLDHDEALRVILAAIREIDAAAYYWQNAEIVWRSTFGRDMTDAEKALRDVSAGAAFDAVWRLEESEGADVCDVHASVLEYVTVRDGADNDPDLHEAREKALRAFDAAIVAGWSRSE